MSGEEFRKLEQESTKNFKEFVIGLSCLALGATAYIVQLHQDNSSFAQKLEDKDKMYIGLLTDKDVYIKKLEDGCNDRDLKEWMNENRHKR